MFEGAFFSKFFFRREKWVCFCFFQRGLVWFNVNGVLFVVIKEFHFPKAVVFFRRVDILSQKSFFYKGLIFFKMGLSFSFFTWGSSFFIFQRGLFSFSKEFVFP